jgi:hypothetical protein
VISTQAQRVLVTGWASFLHGEATMRMHGLVLALKHGVPALAVDPVAGGAKVTAQSRALRWPAVLTPGPAGMLDAGALDRWHDWCLSEAGRRAARSLPRSALGLIPRARNRLQHASLSWLRR